MGMKIGGSRTLIIPPDLAYGKKGAGNLIPPNSTLIFDVKIIDVKPPAYKLIQAKETINLRRKFTEKIINDVSTGIIYIDLNYKVLLYNKKSQQIFGEVIEKDFFNKQS